MEMIASYTHDLNLNQTPLNKNFTATNVTSTYLLLRSPLVQYAKCMILNLFGLNETDTLHSFQYEPNYNEQKFTVAHAYICY